MKKFVLQNYADPLGERGLAMQVMSQGHPNLGVVGRFMREYFPWSSNGKLVERAISSLVKSEIFA